MAPPPPYIYFGKDEAAMSERARLTLDALADFMRRVHAEGGPDLAYLVGVHTDRSGSAEYNLALARRRGAAIREHLVNAGCPPDAIRILPVGEARPAVTTEDGVAEADNRRAVIWTVRDGP